VISSPVLSDSVLAVCIFCILLVPLAIAGLAIINTGLSRSRSAAHAMLASLCVVGLAAVVYLFLGFSWQGVAGRPAHVFTFAGRTWNWIAAAPVPFRGPAFDSSFMSLAAWLEMLSVGLAALIPLGAGADRWRLSASCFSTALLAAWTYPLFAHWVWGGGWLMQLGVNYGLGRGFVDAGGGSTIQVLGGLTALAIAWILGPRRGKYGLDGMPAAIPGHNSVLVLLGCLLAWTGWIGLNAASAILFSGCDPARVVLIGLNTTLAAASAALAGGTITRFRFGKPDASLTANAWVGGLVGISAACAFVTPAAALLVGVVAGVLVTFAVTAFEVHLGVDDPGGAISVHGIAGIWGILAVGLFARFPSAVRNGTTSAVSEPIAHGSGQMLAQLVGLATLLGFVLPLTYGLNWLLNRLCQQRVAIEGEYQGMDLHELGAGAYPEFVTHSEEFTQR
jgi:ammonium transporter, Amt family